MGRSRIHCSGIPTVTHGREQGILGRDLETSHVFHLDPGNQTKGPVTLNGLQQSSQSGLLVPDAFVAKRGDTEWKSLDSIS